MGIYQSKESITGSTDHSVTGSTDQDVYQPIPDIDYSVYKDERIKNMSVYSICKIESIKNSYRFSFCPTDPFTIDIKMSEMPSLINSLKDLSKRENNKYGSYRTASVRTVLDKNIGKITAHQGV